MRMKTRLETNDFLTREMYTARQQVKLYQSNKTRSKLPEKLTGRIKWLVSYAKAVKYIAAMEANGSLKGLNMGNYQSRIDTIVNGDNNVSLQS